MQLQFSQFVPSGAQTRHKMIHPPKQSLRRNKILWQRTCVVAVHCLPNHGVIYLWNSTLTCSVERFAVGAIQNGHMQLEYHLSVITERRLCTELTCRKRITSYFCCYGELPHKESCICSMGCQSCITARRVEHAGDPGPRRGWRGGKAGTEGIRNRMMKGVSLGRLIPVLPFHAFTNREVVVYASRSRFIIYGGIDKHGAMSIT